MQTPFRCARELPIDGVYVNLCLGAEQAARTVRESGATARGSMIVSTWSSRKTTWRPSPAATFAVSMTAHRNGPAFHPGMLATFRAIPANVRREVAVCVGLTGDRPWASSWDRKTLCWRWPMNPRRCIAGFANGKPWRGRAAEICRAGTSGSYGSAKAWPRPVLIGRQMYSEFVLFLTSKNWPTSPPPPGVSLLHISATSRPACRPSPTPGWTESWTPPPIGRRPSRSSGRGCA